jgi:hypothetical protein
MALRDPLIFFSAPVDTYWSATVVGILHDEAETQGWRVATISGLVRPGEHIRDAVFHTIQTAEIFVADLSTADPNVAFELGIASGLGKKTLLLARDASTVVFDVSDRQVLQLDGDINTSRGLLAAALRRLISGPVGASAVVEDPYMRPYDGRHYSYDLPPVVVNVYNGPVFQAPISLSGQASFVGQSIELPKPGDRNALLTALGEAGLPAEDIDDLRNALELDDAGGDVTAGPGPHVQHWWTRLTLGGGSLAGKIAIGASGGVVAKLIETYFGLS